MGFFSPGTTVSVPVLTVTAGVTLGWAPLVILSILCCRRNLTGVRTVFEVFILALIIAVLVAVTIICQSESDKVSAPIVCHFVAVGIRNNVTLVYTQVCSVLDGHVASVHYKVFTVNLNMPLIMEDCSVFPFC